MPIAMARDQPLGVTKPTLFSIAKPTAGCCAPIWFQSSAAGSTSCAPMFGPLPPPAGWATCPICCGRPP